MSGLLAKQPLLSDQDRPLLIAASGGAGHISAMSALIDSFQKEGVHLETIRPIYENQTVTWQRFLLQQQIQMPALLHLEEIYGLLGWTYPFPHFPSELFLQKELELLYHNNQSPRLYYDMLLDFHPAGYDYAAIWNCLQRKGDPVALRKLIDLQEMMQGQSEASVRRQIFHVLQEAHRENRPYSNIISTQPLGVAEICEAMILYEKECMLDENVHSSMLLHHYVTDLPSRHAIHFFSPLKALSAEMKRKVVLHLVGDEKDLHPFIESLLGKEHFHDIVYHDYLHNPLVRKEFKEFKETPKKQIYHQKTAVIMLGSQASYDVLAYLRILLQHEYTIYLVGCAVHKDLVQEIEKEVENQGSTFKNVKILDYLPAAQLCNLFKQADLLILKGGGLTVMEQLALEHPRNQKIFFHYPCSSMEALSSGIPWEDANIQIAKSILTEKNIDVFQTNPKLFEHMLSTI